MEDRTFIEIEQRFNELIFELQIEDNKKIIEFQEKLKALKEKLTLEEQIKKKDEYINILEDDIKYYEKLNEVNENLIESYVKIIEIDEILIENNEKLVKENDDLLNNKKIEILDVEIAIHEIGYYRLELSKTNEKLNNLEKLLKAFKDS